MDEWKEARGNKIGTDKSKMNLIGKSLKSWLGIANNRR